MFRSATDKVRVPVKTKSEPNFLVSKINCDMCKKGPWPTEADVEYHRKKVHQKELLRLLDDSDKHMCSVCLRPQSNREALISHIKARHLLSSKNSTHVGCNIYICDYCDNLFFNKRLLETHIVYTHLLKHDERSVKKIKCPRCCKVVQVKSIWFHLLHHGLLNTSSCPICLDSFDWSIALQQHLTSHSSDLFCGICGYETKNEAYFANHVQTHRKSCVVVDSDKDVSRYFLPRECISGLSKRWSTLFKGVPLPEEVKICIICRAIFESSDTAGMSVHILGDHAPLPEVKTTYKCSCGSDFFNKVMLKHHVFKMKGDHKIAVDPPFEAILPSIEDQNSMDDVIVEIEIADVGEGETIEETAEGVKEKSADANVEIINQIILNDFQQLESMES